MHKIYSPADRRDRAPGDAMRNQAHELNALDNGSTTDTLQWCELHRGHCNDVIPVRRCFDDPNRKSIMFFACPKCLRDLKKAGLISNSEYVGLECFEIVVPRGLSKGQEVALSVTRPKPLRQQSYEITLDALQVTYLRALGLKVIPA